MLMLQKWQWQKVPLGGTIGVFNSSYNAYTLAVVVQEFPSLAKDGQGWLDPVK